MDFGVGNYPHLVARRNRRELAAYEARSARLAAQTDSTDEHVDLHDCDFPLPCGCVVAVDHNRWDWDLTDLASCTEGHTFEQAVALARLN